MKKFTKKTKTILIASALAVVAVASATTYATLTAVTGTVANSFDLEEVETKIEEDVPPDQPINPGETVIKKVKIQNVGKSDALIRARVTITPEELPITLYNNEAELPETIGTNEIGWVYKDGWYYYNTPIARNDYTGFLFTDFLIGETVTQDFDITVYQEAVSAGMYEIGAVVPVDKMEEMFENITVE